MAKERPDRYKMIIITLFGHGPVMLCLSYLIVSSTERYPVIPLVPPSSVTIERDLRIQL